MEQQGFQVQSNNLEFKQVNSNIVDGVKLSADEQQYLLPHFLMLLIGKPGSGKTTLLKQLLTNDQMYHKKFDEVILVSPSYSKMDIRVRQENVKSKFSLDWIFDRIEAINQKQYEKIYGHSLGAKALPGDKHSATGHTKLANSTVLKDDKSRFQMADFIKHHMSKPKPQILRTQVQKTPTEEETKDAEEEQFQLMQQKIYKDIQSMSYHQQQQTHVDVLLVLDDVVSSIKKAEYDPRLSQLIMNRRHLIFNGTISIIIVSQKYTLIPVRLRSNANWLILFQLNPIDFENIYKDVIVHDYSVWKHMLEFVFGKTYRSDTTNMNKQTSQQQQQEEGKTITDFMRSKKYENLGIWVEYNIYFRNFKRIMV